MNAAKDQPGPGPKPDGPTHPTPTRPPAYPPPAPNPAPAKTSITVPPACEPSRYGAPGGARAARPELRGSGRAAHQTPAVVVGCGGGG